MDVESVTSTSQNEYCLTAEMMPAPHADDDLDDDRRQRELQACRDTSPGGSSVTGLARANAHAQVARERDC